MNRSPENGFQPESNDVKRLQLVKNIAASPFVLKTAINDAISRRTNL